MNQEQERLSQIDQLIREIDPTLQLVYPYIHSSTYGTYKVEKNGQLFILKFGMLASREKSALKRIELIDDEFKDDVPKFVHYYDRSIGSILKTFIHGSTLSEIYKRKPEDVNIPRNIPPSAKKQGKKLVNLIHNLGICYLDLNIQNIIYDGKRIKLFDFDSFRFGENLSKENWDNYTKEDMRLIDILI